MSWFRVSKKLWIALALGLIALSLLSCQVPSSISEVLEVVTLTPTATVTLTMTPTPTETIVPTATATVTVVPTATAVTGPYSFVFASDHEGNGEIYRFDSEMSQTTNLTQNPDVDWDPAWSPDGQVIAFTTYRDGNGEIYIMNADGSNPVNVTNDPVDDYMPAWAPDGNQLVFVSERDGHQEIYSIRRDGSDPRRLTETAKGEENRSPNWSPDGSRIAFAGVRGGVESIITMNADGSDSQLVTKWPMKGTHPAWSPDGTEIAFIGWDEENRPGLFVMNADGSNVTWIARSEVWIGSVSWTRQGRWLLFTSWRDQNHEVYALSRDGTQFIRVTEGIAWDDTPDLSPVGGDFQPVEAFPLASGPAEAEPRTTMLRYGMNLADLGKAYLLRDLGFGWSKSFINWEGIEPEKGKFDWVDPDNIVKACMGQGLNIVMRVQWTPEWARPADTMPSHPPTDRQDFADFMSVVAERYKGQVRAYEIWNEQNINYEWGMREPSPAEYVELLKAAYTAIKKADPDALVITGGLSTTGGGGEGAMGDVAYIQGMYQAGLKGFCDAVSTHPYGFGQDPDFDDPWGLSYTRAVAQHDAMVQADDTETPLWVTELGWVIQTNWDLGSQHGPTAVTAEQQADYLVRALQKAETEWPWMGASFVFNLDFSSVPWYESREIMRYYAVLNADRSPRLSYTWLRMFARGG